MLRGIAMHDNPVSQLHNSGIIRTKKKGRWLPTGPFRNNAIRSARWRRRGSRSRRLLLHRRRSYDLSVQPIHGISELEVVDLLALFRPDRRHLGVALRAFRIEMAGERSLAARGELIGFRLILLAQIGH